MPATSRHDPNEKVLPVAHVLIALMRLFAVLPLSWVRALGHGFGWVLWHVARARRHIVRVNLALCFPELSEAQRHDLAYRHFIAFGQSVLDRAWLWHAPLDVVRQRLRWLGDVQAVTAPGPLVMFAPILWGSTLAGLLYCSRFRCRCRSSFRPSPTRWSNNGCERGARGQDRRAPIFAMKACDRSWRASSAVSLCTCRPTWISGARNRFLCPS